MAIFGVLKFWAPVIDHAIPLKASKCWRFSQSASVVVHAQTLQFTHPDIARLEQVVLADGLQEDLRVEPEASRLDDK